MGIFDFMKMKETVCDTPEEKTSSCYSDVWKAVPCHITKAKNVVTEIEFAPDVRVIRDSLCNEMFGLKRVVLPEKLEKIEKRAFRKCIKLQDIQIPNGVKSIERQAFEDLRAMQGKELYIPKSVEYLEEGAFGSLNFPKFVVDADHPYLKMTNDLLLTDGGTTVYRYIGNGIMPCTVPAGVTRIGAEAFLDAPVKNVILPDSVTEIGDRAFKHAAIKKICLPEKLKKIGSEAFLGSALKQIQIPASVKEMGTFVFADCKNLTHVQFDDGMRCNEEYLLPHHTFQSCESLVHVVLPTDLKGIGHEAFGYCSGLENIDIPKSVEEIRQRSFQFCKKLKKIDLPDGVKIIREQLFQGCEQLKEVRMPSQVLEVRGHAFYWCGTLSNVQLPESVNKIERYAFSRSGLQKIHIPDELEVLEERIFFRCEHLQEVTGGKNIRKIGVMAFSECPKLSAFACSPKLELIEESAFEGCKSLKEMEFNGSDPDIKCDVWKGTLWLENNKAKLHEMEEKQIKAGILPGIDHKYRVVGTKLVCQDNPGYFEEELGIHNSSIELVRLDMKPYEFVDEISLNLSDGKVYHVKTWYHPRGDILKCESAPITEAEQEIVLSNIKDPEEKAFWKSMFKENGGKERLLQHPKYRTLYVEGVKKYLPDGNF